MIGTEFYEKEDENDQKERQFAYFEDVLNESGQTNGDSSSYKYQWKLYSPFPPLRVRVILKIDFLSMHTSLKYFFTTILRSVNHNRSGQNAYGPLVGRILRAYVTSKGAKLLPPRRSSDCIAASKRSTMRSQILIFKVGEYLDKTKIQNKISRRTQTTPKGTGQIPKVCTAGCTMYQ